MRDKLFTVCRGRRCGAIQPIMLGKGFENVVLSVAIRYRVMLRTTTHSGAFSLSP